MQKTSGMELQVAIQDDAGVKSAGKTIVKEDQGITTGKNMKNTSRKKLKNETEIIT